MCAVEATFYLWAKSFIPVQMGLLVVAMVVLYYGMKFLNFQTIQMKEYKQDTKKLILLTLCLSVFVGGPFIWKSLRTSGTPLYPFFVGMVGADKINERDPVLWGSLLEKTEVVLNVRNTYGGRSLSDFVKHLWLIAVPENGVNNRYDYPVGLMYLLCLGPFIFILLRSLKKKEFLILPMGIVIFWGIWWLGSHQTRFLFVPLILMGLVVLSQKEFQTKAMGLGVILSLALVCLSVFRAHHYDFGKSFHDVLRDQDKKLLAMSKTVDRAKDIELDFFDVTFADFSVDVVDNNSVFVLKHK